jgi:hypothetical protein
MATKSNLSSVDHSSSGTFHYLQDAVHSSLHRNGRVLTRRDKDGSDGGREGVALVDQKMLVSDARQLADDDKRTVEHHGFELLQSPLGETCVDFFEQRNVVSAYYSDCARLVQGATGASRVVAFDHNVRSAAGKEAKRRIEGGQQVQGPAHVVHGDYTLTSAPQRIRDLAKPPTGNDTYAATLSDGRSLISKEEADAVLEGGQRFSIINVWRNIAAEPVQTHPLALCDAQSVQADELVVFEIHYHDRIGENYFAKHSQTHGWYFYPDMTRDEALLIKQWDSKGPFAQSQGSRADGDDVTSPCTFSFHSAFEDPTTAPDAPQRWSIEVRCVALYL